MSKSVSRPDATAARRDRDPIQIGEWLLRADLGVLRRNDEEARLGAKAVHVLLVLIDAGEAGVSRDTLLDMVWGEHYPSDAVVSRAIADLRSAFGETAGEQAYIRTLPKYGYQLVASCGPAVTSIAAPAPRPRRRRLVAGVAIALAIAIVTAMAWSLRQGHETESVAAMIRLPVPRPLTSAPGLEHQPRISPDGDWVLYAALRPEQPDWDLFRVDTTDGVSQVVAASPGVDEHGPAMSPSGDEVAYVRLDDGGCNVVTQSITLGVPEIIAACTAKFATTVDWSPDGRWLAFTALEADDALGYRRLHVVDHVTGERRMLSVDVSPTGSDYYPRYSPSGQQVAFLRGEPQPDHRATLWLVNVATGVEQQLTQQPTQLGGMTWIDESTLMYVYSDGGQFEGRQRDLRTGADVRFEQAGLVQPDFARQSGLLVVASRRSERDLAVANSNAEIDSVASSTSDDHHGVWSHDGTLVAFISSRSGHDELWIADTRDGASRRLTRLDGPTMRYPDWHPHEQRILFTVQTEAGERLFDINVVSGSVRALGDVDQETTTPRWLNDGEHWVYECRQNNVWGICVGDETGFRPVADGYFRPTPLDDATIAVVDSAGILYQLSLATGVATVILDRLPNNGRNGWAVDAASLVYSASGTAGNSGRVLRRDLVSGDETVLFEGPMPLADTNIDITADGRVLFTQFQAASDDLVMFENAFNAD